MGAWRVLMQGENHSHYRPEIDGLRAIAVLAVVLFHLSPRLLPGGFAGVDVFFVISGYLVGGIILRQRAAGTFRYLDFCQRRIARILPALLCMALAVLGASAWLHTSWDHAGTASAFSASLLGVVNLHLLGQGDYFKLTPDEQPLLHCWSLSVEEQFYVALPAVVLLAGRWLRGRKFTVLLALAAAASLVAGVILTEQKPLHGFYLLPARAWELLVGVLLASREDLRGALRPRPWLLWLGMGLLFLSLGVLTEGRGFPGWRALLPVTGAVLFIAARAGAAWDRLPGARAAAGLGKVSYSLYLWHWPVFCFVDYAVLFESEGFRLACKLGLTVAATWVSWRWVETPARSFLNKPSHRWLAFGLLALVMSICGTWGYARRDSLYIDAWDRKEGRIIFEDAPPSTSTIVVIGDSQACTFSNVLRDIAREHHWRLVILSMAGEDTIAPGGASPPSDYWRENLATVQRERPAAVVIACAWVWKLQQDTLRLQNTVNALSPYTGRVIALTQPALLPFSAQRAGIRAGHRAPFMEDEGERALRTRSNDAVRRTQGAVTIIDTDPLFAAAGGSLRLFDDDGAPLFTGRYHLSGRGASLVRPELEAALQLAVPK